MPKRIQLSRRKGWRKPDGCIVVSRPSKWGNMCVVGTTAQVDYESHEGTPYSSLLTVTPEIAVACYRDEITARLEMVNYADEDDREYGQEWVDALAELRGHDLGCWCPLDQPCHADVLLELANP